MGVTTNEGPDTSFWLPTVVIADEPIELKIADARRQDQVRTNRFL
jgi:hypothetical protein